jgi:hypothetical protein
MVDTVQNGTASAIHCPNEILYPAFSRYETARVFCNDEIGVIMPPRLQANANPMRSVFT